MSRPKSIHNALSSLAVLAGTIESMSAEERAELRRALDRIHNFVEGLTKRNPYLSRKWTEADTCIVEGIISLIDKEPAPAPTADQTTPATKPVGLIKQTGRRPGGTVAESYKDSKP